MLTTRAACSRWLRGCIVRHELPPVFLCPILHSLLPGRPGLVASQSPPQSRSSLRRMHIETTAADTRTKALPLQCPGCGAFSQTTAPDQPGFFNLDRKATQRYLGLLSEVPRPRTEDDLVREALQNADREKLVQYGVDVAGFLPSPGKKLNPERAEVRPLCGRCHDLVHHNTGTSIYHPSIDSIRETLAESTHRKNHVYHVLDAADFPMSLVPRVHDLLELEPLRSRNRRASRPGSLGAYKPEMSFVVTRSDLLAPSRAQVDRLMPWLTETLRDALGRAGQGVRLGNIHLVSAKRAWWTNELRNEIWSRGGAAWMVGKANVGKSYLCQHVFPKGRMDGAGLSSSRSAGAGQEQEPPVVDGPAATGLLLPPPPPETNYPPMPIVSALPGTTASPIRIPFGSGKGEVIDLPGLARTSLNDSVCEEHRESLVMQSRIQPTQQVLKGNRRSLLLGGFIRLTPRNPDVVFLAYNFTPLQEHLTETDKATGIQNQTSSLNVENISIPDTGPTIQLAGSFELKYDVTKQRTGPITRRDAVNIKVDNLPYRVLAVDILVEGCGWVEVVAQVRSKDLFGEGDAGGGHGGPGPMDGGLSEPSWPVIDVYSPEGKFIGARRPLNAWMLCQPKKSLKSRPRKSMKGAKKMAKAATRAATMRPEEVVAD